MEKFDLKANFKNINVTYSYWRVFAYLKRKTMIDIYAPLRIPMYLLSQIWDIALSLCFV